MANRKISDLTALTTPASGDYLPIVDISEAAAADKNKRITVGELLRGVPDGTPVAPGIAFENNPNTGLFRSGNNQISIVTNSNERLVVDSSGNVGVNTTSPASTLDVNGDITITDKIIHGGDTNTAIRFPANDTVSIETSGSEAARIDSSGRLLVGTSSALSNSANDRLQIAAASASGISTSQHIYSFNSGGGVASLKLNRSNSNTLGTNTLVTSGQGIGSINFAGADGSNYINAARIDAEVDGTPGSNDMPGRLVFSTTADGASSPTERMRIDSSGRVGVGTTSPQGIFQVGTDFGGKRGGSNTDIVIADTTSGVTRFFEFQSASDATRSILFSDATTGNYGAIGYIHSDDALIFQTATSERARIDSSGRLLVGTSSALSNSANDRLQIAAASASGISTSQHIYSFNSGGGVASLKLNRSNSNTLGTNTLVTSGQGIGSINFAGADGSNYINAARIDAEVDGTPGSNDMPGRLVFSTTADGASSSTERMRITSTGQVRLAGAGITFNGDTAAANELDDYEEGTWTCQFYSGTTLVAQAGGNGLSGRYVKIGGLVHIIAGGRFQVLNTTAGPYSMNLPFVPSAYGNFNQIARLPIGTIRTTAGLRGWPAATRFYVAATLDANNRHKIGGSDGHPYGTSAPSFTSTGDLDLFIEFTYQI